MMKLQLVLLLSLCMSCLSAQNKSAEQNKQNKIVVSEKEYNTLSSEDAVQTQPELKINLDDQNNENSIYNIVGLDVKPEFPGGIEKFYSFISKNLIISDEVKANKIKGRIFATFVVERNGQLSDIKILRDLKYGTGKEVLRVLNKSPKWSPGQQNGKIVRCQYSIPIAIDGTK